MLILLRFLRYERWLYSEGRSEAGSDSVSLRIAAVLRSGVGPGWDMRALLIRLSYRLSIAFALTIVAVRANHRRTTFAAARGAGVAALIAPFPGAK